MTRIIDESFENTSTPGYDESWTESVGTGCTADENATIPGTAPSGAGSECLYHDLASTGYYAMSQRDYGSGVAISYTRAYIYVDSCSYDTNGDNYYPLYCFSSGWEVVCGVQLYRDNGQNYFRFRIYNNGSTNFYLADNPVSLDTWYRIEFEYDHTNKNWEWRIDGITQDSGTLTGTLYTNIRRWRAGQDWLSTAKAVEFYYDLYAVDDADWVGVEVGPATLEQEGFRWRDDDDDEANATWLENQDVDAEIAQETNVRLRVLLNADGDPASQQYQLEYKETNDGADEWRKVPVS